MKGSIFTALLVSVFVLASAGGSHAACPPPPGTYIMTFQQDPGGIPACPSLLSNPIDILGISTGGSIQGFGFNIILTGNITITAIAPGFVVGNGAFIQNISASGKQGTAMGFPQPGAPSLGSLAVVTLNTTGPGPYSLSFGGNLALNNGIIPVDHLTVGGCDVDSSTTPPLVLLGGSLKCPEFIRSDCNNNGKTAGYVGDIVFLLYNLFLGGPDPECENACDANDDEAKDVSDSIYMIVWQFQAGPQPPLPFGPFPAGCGFDPTPGSLTCDDPICP